MTAMKPDGKATLPVQCPCGWSRLPLRGEDPEEALMYHRIQVHNDQEAARFAIF